HQRHPARRPPALEPEDRTAHRRHRQPAAGGPDPDPAIQRLRRAGGRAVRRHGPAQVVLSRGPAAPTGRGGRRSPAQPAPAPLVAAKAIVHLLALAPLSLLAWRAWLVARGIDIDALGPDPVAAIEHELGQWALRLLLLTLAVTPLRQLTGQPVLLRFRRMLGLYAFAYASLHFAAWLGLDLGGYWRQVFEEIARRPYVTAGFAAWLLLLPLALTSTRGWMRRLGRHWGRLHRLAYGQAAGATADLSPARTEAARPGPRRCRPRPTAARGAVSPGAAAGRRHRRWTRARRRARPLRQRAAVAAALPPRSGGGRRTRPGRPATAARRAPVHR